MLQFLIFVTIVIIIDLKNNPLKTILLPICLLLFLNSISSQIMWDETINVAPSTSGNNHPRIVTDREGNPMVLWFHAERAMFSRWNGTAFETPRILNPLSMTVAGATWMGPDIAVHGDTIYVVFKATPEHEDKSWIIHSY